MKKNEKKTRIHSLMRLAAHEYSADEEKFRQFFNFHKYICMYRYIFDYTYANFISIQIIQNGARIVCNIARVVYTPEKVALLFTL